MSTESPSLSVGGAISMIVNPATEFTKSGISFNSTITPGTHFCLLYSTKQDLIDILVPYFKDGLDKNEYCLWVTSPPLDVYEAITELKNAVPQFDKYLKENRIEIVPHTQWYLKDGTFDESRVLNSWNQKLAQALDRGYARMRVTGNEAWLESRHWANFSEYEKRLHESINGKKMTVLCTYPVASMGAAEILDVAHTHQFAITRRNGSWDVLETSDLEQSKAEIKRLNEELKYQVDNRTNELEESNDLLREEIAERKRVAEELRESEELFSKAFLSSPSTIAIIRVSDGKFLKVNDTFLSIFGFEREEVLGQTPSNLQLYVNPGHWEKMMQTLADGKPVSSVEIQARKKSGEFLDLLIFMELINIMGERCVLSTAYDITTRKRTDEAQRKQKEILQKIIDHIPVLINFTGADGRIQLVNRAWESTLGWTLDEIQKKGVDIFSECYPDPQYRKKVMEFISEARGEWIDFKSRARNGEFIDISWTRFRLSDGTTVGFGVDVSHRKRAEEALRRSEEKFKALFGIAPVGISVLNRQRNIVDMNTTLEQIIRLNKADLLSGAYLRRKYIRPDGTSVSPGEWPSERAIHENRPIYGVEIGIVTEDGEVIWTQVSAAPLSLSEASVVVITHDITERKNAQVALERAFQEIQMLKDQLYKENLALREEIDKTSMFEEIVGTSPALRSVLDRVSKVAPTDSTVLITGETGTGKELIARAIHKRSQRSSRAFVTVSCAAIPPSLIASELFGHEKGAFTGALQQHLGRFELAEGGTLFLDEIGEIPPETQIALLRVLQNHEFERVGGTKTITTDVRIIAATNRNLHGGISANTFRADLFYRISVFPIEIPPLRERQEDIPMLVEYFIHRYAAKAGKKIRGVSKRTLALLQSYPWPGNIRELQNVIERSVIVSEREIFSVDESWLSREPLQTRVTGQPIFLNRLALQEKELIEAALAESKGRISGPSGAALKLGIPSSTLHSKIRSLKIDKYRFKPA